MAEISVILLVSLIALLFLALGYLLGKRITENIWESKLPEIREEAIGRSRAVLTGQFSEQLAPYLPDFPFSPSEARFIGKPVDFIIFKGMDEKNINEVIFVEVKSGNSQLSTSERKLKNVIQGKKVRWAEYTAPLAGSHRLNDASEKKERDELKKKEMNT